MYRLEHRCTRLSLNILAVLHDYYLRNSLILLLVPYMKYHFRKCIIRKICWQNIHKNVINYAVSLKEISEQHCTCHRTSLTISETKYTSVAQNYAKSALKPGPLDPPEI